MRNTGPCPARNIGAMPAARASAAPGFAVRVVRDEKGNFLVFFGMSVAAIFGIVALSFDLGRMAAVQTDLQSFADSVALAAAAELDGEGNSVARACTAAALVADTQSFAAGGRDLTTADIDLVFLSTLLAADDSGAEADKATVATITEPTAANCGAVAAVDQRRAVFVRVNVDPHSVEMNFASVVSVMTGGSEVEGSPEATATAGFTQFACDIAPLMFCLPRNADNTGPGTLSIGQMVHLRKGGSDAAWGPGNFGFLDVSEVYADTGGACAGISSTAERIRCLLGATEAVTRCYSVRGVSTDPGQSVGITVEPFNFRFDIFDKNDDAERLDPEHDFAPAPNVMYGQEPTINFRTRKTSGTTAEIDYCSPISDGEPGNNDHDIETSTGLPRGADMTADGTKRFGDFNTGLNLGTFAPGTAERNAYMELNHNWDSSVGSDPFHDFKTRWDVYREEIRRAGSGSLLPPMLDDAGKPVPLLDDNGNPVPERDDAGKPVVDASGNPVYMNARQESGVAQCSPVASPDPYRRVVVAAGIDCTANQVKGKTSGLPVEMFYELFLTEPVRDLGGSDLSMYGEVIGFAGGKGSGSTSNGIFRDVVQLYR